MTELEQLISQQNELYARYESLRNDLNDMKQKARVGVALDVVGRMEYQARHPHNRSFRKVIPAFGTTTSPIDVSFSLGKEPFYWLGAIFAQKRIAGSEPLQTYLPNASIISTTDDLVKGLAFEFSWKTNLGIEIDDNYRDSAELSGNLNQQLLLPAQQEFPSDTILTVKVKPLAVAQNPDEYEMYVTVIGVQMRSDVLNKKDIR